MSYARYKQHHIQRRQSAGAREARREMDAATLRSLELSQIRAGNVLPRTGDTEGERARDEAAERRQAEEDRRAGHAALAIAGRVG